MDSQILQVLYIVLTLFIIVIGILNSIVLRKLIKILNTFNEMITLFNNVKQFFFLYSQIPEMIFWYIKGILLGKKKK